MSSSHPLEPVPESGHSAAPPGRFRRRWLRRPGPWIAGLCVLVVLFYAAEGYVNTAPLIGENPRWRGMNRGPADYGLASETVAFSSTDGIALKAWWLPAAGSARANIIIAHGIDHTRQVMLPRAAFLVHAGYNVLALDLRGHGESAAQYSSPGYLEARDVLGAIQYVRSRGRHEPIVLMGVSLGAATSLLAAAQSSEVAAVVADGAYPSGKAVFENINSHFAQSSKVNPLLRAVFLINNLPGVPRAAALVYYLRTGVNLGSDLISVLPAASRLQIPVLLISGGHDWIVPTAQARQIFDVLPTVHKSLVVVPNANHDTTYTTAPMLYEKAVLSFLDANLPK